MFVEDRVVFVWNRELCVYVWKRKVCECVGDKETRT